MKKVKNKTFFSGIKLNEPLAKYTTFKIGGRAKYFFVAKNDKELIRALAWAKEKKVPYFILGGGSNLLVSDKGFKGLIIKCQMSKLSAKGGSPPEADGPRAHASGGKCQSASWRTKFKIIKAASGVALNRLVALSVRQGLTGLEWTVGIPGTVGGAVVGNAAAFGQSMADIIDYVRVLEIMDKKNKKLNIKNKKYILKIKKFLNKDCQFKYRDSLFKHNKNLIILSVELRLKKRDKTEIQKKINEYLNYRKKAQPLNSSAGSVFKNIEIASLKNKKILKIIPKEKIKGRKFPAGYLIEKVGLRGKKQGQAQIAEKHANFIVNLGGAKAQDVISLINLAKRKVKKKFGIKLEEEIKYLGF